MPQSTRTDSHPTWRRKEILLLGLLLIVCTSVGAQSSAVYFPSAAGNCWKYDRYPLDSLQNRIPQGLRTDTDSLAGQVQVGGLSASFLFNKAKSESTFVSVSGSAISEYGAGFPRLFSLIQVDSLGLGFVWNYVNWYKYMDFTATPGVTDTLLVIKNQVVYFKGQYVTLIIRLRATRGKDTTITVPAGTFSTAKFEIALDVNIPRSQAPFGRYEVAIFRLVDSLFVAENKWVVREIQPSTFYPLNNDPSYNVDTTKLPGFERVLSSATITTVETPPEIVRTFGLDQNYPNPFNPSTVIGYHLTEGSEVMMKVFDRLGREVALLVDGYRAAGSYSVQWDAVSLPSGIYFCDLRAGGFHSVRKMVLVR